MSNLRIFSIYDSLNYGVQNFEDLSEFKNKFLQENKPFIILNSFGSEYNQETISQIKLEVKDDKRALYLIHYYDGEKKYNPDENEVKDILSHQIDVDNILTGYLESKKSYLIKSKELCDEIIKRTEAFKEDKEGINDFIETYGETFSKDCKKYLDMIENSPKEIEALFPKFKDSIENNIDMYNDIMKKIEKFMDNEVKIDSNDKSFDGKTLEEKKYIIKENDSIIKKRILNMIDIQELLYILEKKMKELLIYCEKINFLLNLAEIPNIYNQIDKKSLKKEYKRRNKFNYLYEKIIQFVQSDLIENEFELRKDFIKKNFKLPNEFKMEKNTLTILNKLINCEVEKLSIKESELFKSNLDLVDDLTKSIDELTEYLKRVADELFSETKKNINPENKTKPKIILNHPKSKSGNDKYSDQFVEIKQMIRTSSIPQLSQNKIINLIDSELKNTNKKFNNNKSPIKKESIKDYDNLSFINDSISSSFNNSNNNNINKIVKTFSDIYGKFLWFYEKVFNYLLVYKQKYDNDKIEYELNKNDPFSLNSYLISILNENKLLKDNLNKLKKK